MGSGTFRSMYLRFGEEAIHIGDRIWGLGLPVITFSLCIPLRPSMLKLLKQEREIIPRKDDLPHRLEFLNDAAWLHAEKGKISLGGWFMALRWGLGGRIIHLFLFSGFLLVFLFSFFGKESFRIYHLRIWENVGRIMDLSTFSLESSLKGGYINFRLIMCR